MMRIFYRFILTFNSLLLLLVVYLIKSHIWIWEQEQWSIAVYLLVPITLSIVCIKISDFLSLDSIEYVQTIEVGEESYMAVYLGYFFVGTSISDGDWITLICVFGMIFLFVFCSQAQYFNPIFLLLGYKFYGVTKKNGVKIFVISKRRIQETEGLQFLDLRRINDFTFIDKGC